MVHGFGPLLLQMGTGGVTVFDAIVNIVGALVLMFDEDTFHRLFVAFASIPECSLFKVLSVILGLVTTTGSFANDSYTTVEQKFTGAFALTSSILQVGMYVLIILLIIVCLLLFLNFRSLVFRLLYVYVAVSQLVNSVSTKFNEYNAYNWTTAVVVNRPWTMCVCKCDYYVSSDVGVCDTVRLSVTLVCVSCFDGPPGFYELAVSLLHYYVCIYSIVLMNSP